MGTSVPTCGVEIQETRCPAKWRPRFREPRRRPDRKAHRGRLLKRTRPGMRRPGLLGKGDVPSGKLIVDVAATENDNPQRGRTPLARASRHLLALGLAKDAPVERILSKMDKRIFQRDRSIPEVPLPDLLR